MKPIRVALSGSGFRLGAHLGALQAIGDAGYDPVELAGTSGGSIVAALVAAGLLTMAEMRMLLMSLDWAPLMRFSAWSLMRHGALCSGDALLDFLMEKTGGKTFAQLDVALKIIASDLVTEKEFVFSRETTPNAPIALAARASASIPLVFAPVEYGGACLQDGGMCDNIPASRLTVDAVPRVGIYLVSEDPPLLPAKRSVIDLALRIIDMLLASNEAARVDLDTSAGARILRVETAYASSFDRHMPESIRERLFNDGYAAAHAALVSAAA
jgi:NTE family protein